MFVDTHAHLYSEQFDADRDAVLQRALDAGVGKMYLPNVDSGSITGMLALEAAYPDHCFAMMGLHPCSVQAEFEKELLVVEEWLGKRHFCAIGEIGVDLYWDKTFLEQQLTAFHRQLDWAESLKIPVVIHSRNSTREILDALKKNVTYRQGGIFHCFSGTAEEAREAIGLGFYLGVGGTLTYKKSGVAEALEDISVEHLVLETDAPYLSPVPFRGKRNESAYLPHVAQKLADIKETVISEVAQITAMNAEKIFKRNKNAPFI